MFMRGLNCFKRHKLFKPHILGGTKPIIDMNNLHNGLMTRKEVAKELRVSTTTVRRWTEEGVLKCIKVKGSIRYHKDEIEKLLTPKESSNG